MSRCTRIIKRLPNTVCNDLLPSAINV